MLKTICRNERDGDGIVAIYELIVLRTFVQLAPAELHPRLVVVEESCAAIVDEADHSCLVAVKAPYPVEAVSWLLASRAFIVGR